MNSLTLEERKELARKAANKRWDNARAKKRQDQSSGKKQFLPVIEAVPLQSDIDGNRVVWGGAIEGSSGSTLSSQG